MRARSRLPPLPSVGLLLATLSVAQAQPRVAFPSSTLAGYARTIRGEELVYHSPLPWVDKSLLVRSLDRGMDITWETATVPPDFAGDTAVFVFALGIDVTDTTRTFTFFVDTDSVLTFSSPPVARLGAHEWTGRAGIRIDFRATLVDKYGDLMGYAFLHVPRARISPGRPLALRVAGESAGKRTWFMVFKEPLAEGVILRNAPALIRSPSGNRQVIRVDLLTLGERSRFRMSGPLGVIDTTVGIGHTRIQLPIPAVSDDTDVGLAVGLDDRTQEAVFTVRKVTPLEVHLIHHTHLDIGYTEHQDSVERRHWSHLREAMRLGGASAGAPDGERFVWNPEGLWAVESFLATHPGDSAAFRAAVRQGWIVLDAMFANLLTGMTSTEGLAHALDAKRQLEAFTGVPIVSAMQSDIPGATWGLVPLFARHGVRYFSLGPNQGHRIGHFTDALGDRPFWWVSDDGKDSVLTWSHGAGYSLFHTGLGYTQLRRALDEENVFRYLDQLASAAWPYHLTVLRYNIGSDNGPPDPLLTEAVRTWNERYASPRLVISSVPRAFRAFEERYGASLPALRGDLTGHWEDGVQSTARETAGLRRTAEALQQTEDLAGRWGVPLPADTLALAWKHVLLYYEHTWGAWNSIGEPEAAPVVAQWARKKSFADSAALLTFELREGLLARRRPVLAPGTVEVWNTTPTARTDLVVLREGAAVTDDRGREVPSQVLRDGRLAFLARDVPARGFRSYRVRAGSPPRPETAPRASAETERFRVTVDAERGRIASVVDKATGRELVAQGTEGGLAVYAYVPGRDPAAAVPAEPGTLVAGEDGPLVRSLVWRAAAPGTEGIEIEVTLVEGLPRLGIRTRLDKRLVYEPEAVLYRFAFATQPADVRVSVPGGAFALEREQLPGANRNYLTARSWVELRHGTGRDADNIVLVTLDVPMVQVGELGSDPIVTGWRTRADPSGTIWSYAMNNYWETNYRAAQDGRFEARFVVTAGADPEGAAQAATRPLIVVR
jgi:alpha-mannosidase